MDGDFFDPFRWFVWVFIAIGAAALAGAFFWARRRLSLLRRGARAPGVVVSSESSSGSNGRTVYYPIAEFHTPDGRTHRIRGSTGSSGRTIGTGRKVTIVYDPADPTSAFIDTFVQAWLGPVGIAIFGAAFFGFGWLALSAMDMGNEIEAQARAQRDKLQSRLEHKQQEADEDEPEETQSGTQVPTDLFAKPKR